MEAGFEDYLTKPLDSSVLEQTVKTLLPQEKVIETEGLSGKVAPAEERREDEISEIDVDDVLEFRPGGSASDDVMEFSPEKESVQSFDDVMEFSPVSSKKVQSQTISPIRERLTAIEGLDYDTALHFCDGDESFLTEVVADTVSEYEERSERMRKNLAAKDIKAYEIDAHTIKSNMATLGLKDLSERAKKRDFAAKHSDIDFILGDAEAFIDEYSDVCRKMKE